MGHRLLNGTKAHLEWAAPKIRSGVIKAFGLDQPTPRVVKKEKKVGCPPRKPTDPITDEVLARMRGDHELRGVDRASIARDYGISRERCDQLLNYVNRTKVRAA